MAILSGFFLVVLGLATMSLGLFLFYTLLPVLYALFGFGVGYELGTMITGVPAGEGSFVNLLFAIAGSVVFTAATFVLEQFRRALAGIGLGALFGGAIATALGLTG